MKIKNSPCASIVVCFALLLSFSKAQAQKLVEENFEAFDSGTTLDTMGSDGGDGWRLAGFDIPDASATVVEGASTSGNGDNQRLLHLKRPEARGMNFGRLFEEASSESAPKGIRVAMKFMVQEGFEESSDLVFGFLEKSRATFSGAHMVGVFRLRFQEPNHSQFAYYLGQGDTEGASYARVQDVPFRPGQWYELKLTLDLAGQTWGFLLSNLDTEEYATVENIPFGRDVFSVTGIGLCNRTPPAALNHFFDDFVVEIVE